MVLFVLFLATGAQAQNNTGNPFKVIPLGVLGGADESNLSCYMIGVNGTNNYVCMDGGTVYAGIAKGISNGVFTGNAADVLKQQIKGFCISHAHLDHVAGLIINSPDDSSKNIYGMPYCLDILKSHYFTWKNWANFTDDGDKPALKKYHYVPMAADSTIAVAGTNMNVTAFPLSHGNPYQSTAFLLQYQHNAILYLGDTGADSIEKAPNLSLLWQKVAPLIISHQLKAIFIEVSFANEQPTNKLFGHLTPALLMQEMQSLSTITGKAALNNFPIVITHMKPVGNAEQRIQEQLLQSNTLALQLVFPQQAVPLEF